MTELAMMLAVSGAIGLQGRKVLRMRRGPRLRLRVGERRGPDRVRLENRPALRWTVRLENAGTGPATGCQALLERLERFDGALWQQHPGFPVPIPLPWSGSGARPRLDIGPGETTGDLPILHTYPDAQKLRLATPLQISAGLLLDYPPGTYRLTVSVRTTGPGEFHLRRRLVVRFDGNPEALHIEDAGA
jgi:hypothetical protein